MKRKVQVDDLYLVNYVSDAQISPDGSRVAYAAHGIDREQNTYRSDIHLVDGSRAIQTLTRDMGNCDMPRWSPNGRQLLFLSSKTGNKQLYLIDLEIDEVEQITDLDYSVLFPAWSPDGKKIAFFSFINDPSVDTEAIHMTSRRIKADGLKGFIDYSKKQHLFVLNLETKKVSQVTPDDFFLYAPEWSATYTPGWSSDSHQLVFTAQPQDREAREKASWKSDVYVANLDEGSVRSVKHLVGPAEKAIWGKDDTAIYYVGHLNEKQRATTQRICQIDLKDDSFSILSNALDRSVGHFTYFDLGYGYSDSLPKYSEKRNAVYFLGNNDGKNNIFALNLDTQEITVKIGGDRRIYGFSLSGTEDQMAICYSSTDVINDISVIDLASGIEERWTHSNAELMDEIILAKPEAISYTAKDGLTEHGWYIKPVDYQEGKTYPAVLYIHGGPMMQFGWTYLFDFQLLAAAGYAVIYCNPRGSRGYGESYTYALKDNYGGMDFEDFMSFTDTMIDQGFIDENRIGVTGPSYGGFMTNWIITHTDRFRAAIPQVSVTNWMTMVTIGDSGVNTSELLLMDKIENLIDLWDLSPLAYVKNIHTPTLIIHSECDMRCPIDQGEQLYGAMKEHGKEVEMVRFPESNHNLLRFGKPSLRILRHHYMLNFFKKHLG